MLNTKIAYFWALIQSSINGYSFVYANVFTHHYPLASSYTVSLASLQTAPHPTYVCVCVCCVCVLCVCVCVGVHENKQNNIQIIQCT